MMKKRILAGVIATMAGAMVTTSSYAQIEEIIVTAQKRAENQQAVPVSVTALGDDFLVDNNIKSFEDLNGSVPGLMTTSDVNYGGAPISIRGIGGFNGGGNFFGDEPVGVYVDGVYVGRLSFSTAALLDIESIEVLRGPQGTLYGRNSTAGALLVSSKKPTDTFEGEVRAGLAEGDQRKLSTVISGPLTDALSARLVLGHTRKDGFGTNRVDGSDIGQAESNTVRLSATYDVNETTDATLVIDHQTQSSKPGQIAVAALSDGMGIASPFEPRPDLGSLIASDTYEANDEIYSKVDTTSLSLTVNTELDWATVGSITGFRDWSLTGAQDSDNTRYTLFSNNGATSSEQISQEFKFVSTLDGPLSWVGGVFYFHENIDLQFNIRNHQGLFGLGSAAAFTGSQSVDAYALFGNASYQLSDHLSLSLGGRYSYEQKDFKVKQTVGFINGGTPAFGPLAGVPVSAGQIFVAPPEYVDDTSFNDFSPRVVLDYEVNENLFLYASYSQGFKSGGFNAFSLSSAFEQEDIDAYEIGIKSEWFDNTVRLNSSFYRYDYDNLQLRLPVPTGGVNIQNAAVAENTGFETELTVNTGNGFEVSANLAYLDTEITEGTLPAVPSDIAPYLVGSPLTLIDEDVTGKQLTRAPKWQAAMKVSYEYLTNTLRWNASANYKYQDSVYFLETNQDTTTGKNNAWRETDIRLAVSNIADTWEVAVYGKNITDDRHISQITYYGGFPHAAINEPRRWGVETVIRF